MMHLGWTGLTFDVAKLRQELLSNPSLWNQIPYRTAFEGSPHREIDDIWIRYNALKNFDPANPSVFNEPHISVWYPVVAQLPSARALAIELASMLMVDKLGGVLITRVPPHSKVHPHTDPGWHARFHEKFIIQIEGNEKQAFHFEGESLSALPGQCYWFDNQFEHWVTNDSDEDRVSLIVCVRRERCH